MNHEELLQMGRNAAVETLTKAVENCSTPEQLNDQLHVLNCFAVHILATNGFNQIKDLGQSQVQVVMDLKEDIENEMDALFAHVDEMETVAMKNAEQ